VWRGFDDVKTRGVDDIRIAVTDDLKGSGEALEAVFFGALPVTTWRTSRPALRNPTADWVRPAIRRGAM